MLDENGVAPGRRADFGRASFRAKLTPLGAEAEEFLKACIARGTKTLRLWRVGGWLLLGAQIVGWWSYFLASGDPLHRLGGKLFLSLLFPVGVFFIAFLPAYFWRKKVKLPRLTRDLQGGVLAVAEQAPFHRSVLNTGRRFYYGVIVDDVKITAPLRKHLHQNIPSSGEGTFEYFPSSLLCWKYNGKCVWEGRAFRFW